jgi:hypothetical protein
MVISGGWVAGRTARYRRPTCWHAVPDDFVAEDVSQIEWTLCGVPVAGWSKAWSERRPTGLLICLRCWNLTTPAGRVHPMRAVGQVA